MIKSVQRLAAVISPTAAPLVTIDTQQKLIEVFEVFGTRLPEDYLQFHRTYGEGYFFSLSHKMSATVHVYGNVYHVGAPHHQNALRYAAPQRLNELRLIKEMRPKRVPYPLFCEPSGLLPWGGASNGLDLCWRVHGDLVDNWRVVALRAGTGQHQEFQCGMVDFLAGVISGTLDCDLLPKGFPGRKGVGWCADGGLETFAAPPAG